MNKTTRSRVRLCLGCLATLSAVGLLWRVRAGASAQGPKVVAHPTAHLPDAVKNGNVEDTLRRCRQILDTFRANNWDDLKVPDEMLILPDRVYAEQNWHRAPHIPNVYFPKGPEFRDVAFATDLYFRMNSTWYEGDRVSHAPSGFFIVAWKDGRIEKVPPADLRMMRVISTANPNTTERTVVWPGIPGYREDLEPYAPATKFPQE